MGNIIQIGVSIIIPHVLHTRFAFRCSFICFFINGTNNIIYNTRYFLGPCGPVLSTIVPIILFFRDMLNGHKTCDWLLTPQRAGKSPAPPDKIFLSTLCQQGGKLKAIYRLQYNTYFPYYYIVVSRKSSRIKVVFHIYT